MTLREAVVAYMVASNNMHVMYGSTSVCYGGIGGQAMTLHCVHTCHNDGAHAAAREEYDKAHRDLYAALEEGQ